MKHFKFLTLIIVFFEVLVTPISNNLNISSLQLQNMNLSFNSQQFSNFTFNNTNNLIFFTLSGPPGQFPHSAVDKIQVSGYINSFSIFLKISISKNGHFFKVKF